MKKIAKICKEHQKTNSFINKHNWKEINYPAGKAGWKTFEKKSYKLLIMCYMLENWIYTMLTFKNTS